MTAQELIQERLRQRYLESKLKNPRGSIRSFARTLKMQSGTISLILLGKRKVSYKLASKLADALYFDPMERARIDHEMSAAKGVRKNRGTPSQATSLKLENLRLSADQFHVLKDWHSFAILNLVSNQDYQHDVGWIARRLSIKEEVCKESLDRLLRLGLIEFDKKGRAVRRHLKLNSTDEIRSLSLQYSHQQSLELARTALETLNLNQRDFTWVTLPVQFEELTEMKIAIREFQDSFIDRFGIQKTSDQVFRLNMHLFPLTQIEPTSSARKKK